MMDVRPASQHDTNDIRLEEAEYRLWESVRRAPHNKRGAKTPKDRKREQAKRAVISTPLNAAEPCDNKIRL